MLTVSVTLMIFIILSWVSIGRPAQRRREERIRRAIEVRVRAAEKEKNVSGNR